MLSVENLSKSFDGVHAVDRATWTLGNDSVHCIIGPNGAGKSTFFNLLLGALRPDGGKILFRDEDITKYHPFQRARCGIAVKPQTTGVFTQLTVEHNIRVALQWSTPTEKVEDEIRVHLEGLGLVTKRHYPAAHLSHGEKQWLGIGMALAQKPRLILLDEPTAGMSPDETSKTCEIINAVANEGRALIVIEHDMSFVRELGAAITVFNNGSVFASGDIHEVEANEDVRHIYLGRRGAELLRTESGD